MVKTNDLKWFSRVSFFEGVSFVLLLFIAMPLKYLANIPEAVKYLGWVHGVLFILYGFLLANVAYNHRYKMGKIMLYFVCSLIPFAPFWVEKQIKKEMKGIKV